jgi:ADP-ribose pyrophosphatase YjhB (NUDIX family)
MIRRSGNRLAEKVMRHFKKLARDSDAKPVPTFADRALDVTDPRNYPDRPYLAVSAVIVRGGEFLAVRRARPPMEGLFTVPGGGVEAGESLTEAVQREVREETGLVIEPVALAGYREVINRDGAGGVQRHFVILAFAARWVTGEPKLNDEITEARWMRPAALQDLSTTEGLAEIVAAAFERLE